MDNLISRPARGALPVLLAVCAALLPGGAERATAFMGALMLARGLSLGAGGALRAAAGAVVRASRLRGNMLTAVIMAVVGGIVSVALCSMDIPYLCDIGIWTAAAGAAVNISQLMADRMYTSRDKKSAAMYDMVVAVLTAAGVMIADTDKWLLPLLTGCGAAAGILLTAGLRSGTSVQTGLKVLRYAPGSLVRGWIFPALIVFGMLAADIAEHEKAAFMLAVAVIEGCEPAYRRSPEESSLCAVLLTVIAFVWTVSCTIGSCFEAQLPEYYSCAHIITVHFMAAVPVGCYIAMLTGVHIDLQRAAQALLLTTSAGIVIYMYHTGIAALHTAGLFALLIQIICLLMCIPDIALLRLRIRARKIQKRRR